MAIFISSSHATLYFIIEKHPHVLLSIQKGMRSVIERTTQSNQKEDENVKM